MALLAFIVSACFFAVDRIKGGLIAAVLGWAAILAVVLWEQLTKAIG